MGSNIDLIYTEKQQEVYKDVLKKDWFISILHGAKRSGKTQINNDLFLRELIRVKKIAAKKGIDEPMYILAGVSSKTIQNNVLSELTNKYGIDFKFDRHGSFKLFGVKIVQAFTGTIAGLGGIRGMTSFGAYINEASLARKEVFAEIISRCSGDGARVLVDTNPDNPEHWLLKDYILNPDENIIEHKFRLDDNTFLSDRYINNIKASTPSGMFYDRDINGDWVSGEGVVYADFDKNRHYFDPKTQKVYQSTFCGVDWGYKHYGAIVVIGKGYDGKYYMLEEYAKTLKEIDYWENIAKDIYKRYGDIPFYCDTARPEYIYRFINCGLDARNASKERMAGIEFVAKQFKTDNLYICSSAKRFREEIYSYIWNKDTGDTIKLYDDVLDALRYALYSHEVDSVSVNLFEEGI